MLSTYSGDLLFSQITRSCRRAHLLSIEDTAKKQNHLSSKSPKMELNHKT